PAAHEPRPTPRRPQGPPLGLLRPGEGLSGAFAGAPLGVGTASRAGRHRPDPARLAGPTLLCYNPRPHPTSPSAPFFVSIFRLEGEEEEEGGRMDSQNEFLPLFLKHQVGIRAFLGSLVRDPHARNDLFQEVALVLWHEFPRYDRARSFGAWA